VAHAGERSIGQGFGRHVDCRRNLPARARHASIGYKRYALAAILEHAQRRRKLVEFGHSVGAWPLKADDDDTIAAKFAGLEGGEHLVLIRKAPSRGFDQPSILVDGTGFYYCAAKITAEQPETAVGPERLRYRPQHVDIGAF